MAERCKYFNPKPTKNSKLPECRLLYKISLVKNKINGETRYFFKGDANCPLIKNGLASSDCTVLQTPSRSSERLGKAVNTVYPFKHKDILKPLPQITYK